LEAVTMKEHSVTASLAAPEIIPVTAFNSRPLGRSRAQKIVFGIPNLRAGVKFTGTPTTREGPGV
jgi:hypothetical protein